MHIRPADLGDLPAIAALERGDPSPWSALQIEEELLHKQGITLIVTEEAGKGEPIGWCCVRMMPPECELLKIRISPPRQKRGFGAALFAEIIEFCRRRGCLEMYLEVRMSNMTARKLYRSFGFKESGRRKAYYSNPTEDALVMKTVFARQDT